ncbi:MAG: DNA polymerase/3'-5' exonuclease PolX [Chitinophagaceae bacterium]|nr:DNA polymerase/3'-5' exonuclease PolX [Chitinophagaceae bacterium]
MDNAAIAEHFSLLAKLLDIHGDNSFKPKTYAAAAFNIEKLPAQLATTELSEMAGIRGIGESVSKKIKELLETGRLAALDEIIFNTPPGVIEMLQIKGIGPKKINTIWKEMGIESIGELLYACHENRLTRYKGFGEKTQKNVEESIQFYLLNQGHFLFAELDSVFPQIDGYLKKLFGNSKVHITGAYRRHDLTIEEMEFVVLEKSQNTKPKFQTAQPPELLEENETSLLYKLKNGLKLRLYTGGENLSKEVFLKTGPEAFTQAFLEKYPKTSFKPGGEADQSVFTEAGIPFIEPWLRGKEGVLELAAGNKLPKVIETADIRAIIHSHSNWSDGVNTLEEMAAACIAKNYEYLVISDHSQSAFYANGLKEDRIREQHKLVDQLNLKLAPFKIFKSIESDILNDGQLDYPESVLKTFDLVIASVHSNLGMNEDKANQRLLKAIENPYTAILGHMTGRLLLSRNGYPVDHRKIIDACASNNVVIELNAHPRRLDIDWKWIGYAMDKGVLISIDPDAHATEGYEDVKYGVLAAQKGGLTASCNLSSFTLEEFGSFLENQKKKK